MGPVCLWLQRQIVDELWLPYIAVDWGGEGEASVEEWETPFFAGVDVRYCEIMGVSTVDE